MPRGPWLLAICLILAPGIVFPQTTLTGTLRRITDDRVIIQTDKSALTVVFGITTKYYKGSPSGAMIRSADFQPGDHISITATQDGRLSRSHHQPDQTRHARRARRRVQIRRHRSRGLRSSPASPRHPAPEAQFES
jgi:hypothetical protein